MPFKNLEDKQEYQREWLQKRKDRYFKNKKCKKCGSNRNLILHHRDPDAKESHKIWSWAPQRFWDEIRKCDVLCEKCHEELHAKKNRKDSESEK